MPEANHSLENEWSLLRIACSAHSATTSEELHRVLCLPLKWDALFELAAQHGVQPLLCQALSHSGEIISAQELSTSKRLHQANVHKALFLAREMISVLDCLESRGIDVLPYKGLALAESFYGDIALRQPGDIDLLIRPDDLPKIRDGVRELGYVPHFAVPEQFESHYLRSGYECAFDGTAGRNLLEVQWAIQPRFYAVDFDMEGLFARSESVKVAGRKVKTPSPEDLFIILSLHAVKHVWGRLIWLCDLERIMNRSPLDWKWIGLEAQRLGIVRILHVNLSLMKRLLGAELPPEAAHWLPNDLNATEIARRIEALMIRSTPFDTESSDYFRLMLRLRERQTDRFRFLTRLVLTPGPGEWETIKLPRALTPLYRVIRVSRLAGRLVRQKK